jgi:hypothetical protein
LGLTTPGLRSNRWTIAADEVAAASVILRRAGFVEEALVAAGIATARGADLPAETKKTPQRWQVRRRGPFSRAA